jgi:translation elongation factor EF-Tu-like GTPase
LALAPIETTPPPSEPTDTPTFVPVQAVVSGTGDQGAFLRDAPGGVWIGSLKEGETVYIIGPAETKDGQVWIHVRTESGQEGWMAVEFCATLTPTATP